MKSAPLPDCNKMIISFWFREIQKQQPKPEGPKIDQWPQGFWTAGSQTMVPPNAQYSATYDGAFTNCTFYYNPYGIPAEGMFFGDLFLGAASVWIPNPPIMPQNTMTTKDGGTSGLGQDPAIVSMSEYGIRALLVFGDPNIPYQYTEWEGWDPGVIDAVQYLPNVGIAPTFIVPDWPPPYIPYIKVKAGKPIGDDGKLHVRSYRTAGKTTRFNVPPCFIGIDDNGDLVINLQTNTTATYKGMCFEQTGITEIIAAITYLHVTGPPYSYTQLGFPFPDGVWIQIDGYWDGYQFEYQDCSQKVMAAAPESFLLYGASTGLLDFNFSGPKVQNGTWHHVLFSFDISGGVEIVGQETPEGQVTPAPTGSTGCRAWLAFDDKNMTGASLQNRPPVHDGFMLPKLWGTQTTQILDCGPCTTIGRNTINMGPNDILPRNAWLRGSSGNPKDDLMRFVSAARVVEEDGTSANNWALAYGSQVGDFNPLDWTGSIWPLYGHGVAPGPWLGKLSPPRPTVPDPKKFFSVPHYSCGGFMLPISGHPIGIPASSDMLKHNTGVEMAELQIWCGQSLDTGDLGMRRLFIDKKGKPVSPARAAKRLGKPDILLHGTANWKKGRNTGKSGIDAKGKPIRAGQFEPVAKIEKFKPDPELGK